MLEISKVQELVEDKVVPKLVAEVIKPMFDKFHWVRDPQMLAYWEWDCSAINITFVNITLNGESHEKSETFSYILGIRNCVDSPEFIPDRTIKVYVPESGRRFDNDVSALIWAGLFKWDFELEV